jgi:hypothetical protein
VKLGPIAALAIFSLAAGVAAADSARADDARAEDFFENRIRPVLAGVCLRCHGEQKQSGGLRLDSRDGLIKGGESGPAIDRSNLDQSLLLDAVRRVEDVSAMPPDRPLPPHHVADLAAWVKAGAPWPKRTARIQATTHWAFQPIRDAAPPAVQDDRWVKSSVDRFILARLEAVGRKPAPPADRRTLLRRLTYDLTGLPPLPEEVVAFEADLSPRALETVVDRLLDSPHYGEHWGRHWLDVVRYADTAGETADYPLPLAWRYRNYVIDSFNADKPYDEFLREQIAGDVLASEGPRELYAERATATGFLAISRRFGFDSENYQHLTIQDTIDTLGQTVLGLSLGCARCHDHKFDTISMNDYYALYGIFDSSRYAFPGSEQKQQVRAMLPLLPPGESQPRWQAFDARVAALALELEKENQPVPKAILRSLHDVDGDFELQAPAAGGSNGVLVPPWLYQGKIAVTTSAQSSFKNVYARGKVGVSVPEDAGLYRIAQAIYPRRSPENCNVLHVNLDFRVGDQEAGTNTLHRFWIGEQPNSPAAEVLISADAISLRMGETTERIAALQEKQWQNLHLALDLRSRSLSGSVGTPDHSTAFSAKPFSAGWSGRIDLVVLEALEKPATGAGAEARLPAIEFDNFALQETEIRPVSTAPAVTPEAAAIETSTEAARAALEKLLADGPFGMTYGMAEGTPHNVRTQMRGEPERPGAIIPRGFIKALGGGPLPANTSGSGRLELARWVTRPDDPLAARVMVNRIWQHHFGHGLVRTPNDFGVRGSPPSHPELLDHLATKFIQSGWSIKAMHRLLILSSTYQQSSIAGARVPDAAHDSFGGQLWSPFSRRRLSAEELRDSILAISGELDGTVARGHPFPPPVGWGYTQHAPFFGLYDHNRRSIYLMTQRIKRHPFLALFDGADPNATTAERVMTTVPTQALFFLNDPFVHTKAEKCAGRLLAERPDELRAIELAWRTVLQRSPGEDELDEARQFLSDYRSLLAAAGRNDVELQALAAYVRTLVGSNEFVYLD